MIENLLQGRGFWTVKGPHNHVVLSSRLRLARNMKGICFPGRMINSDAKLLRSAVEKFLDEFTPQERPSIIDIDSIGSGEKRLLRERNIITSEMELSDGSYVVVSPDEEYAVLVNEEDHVRIQVIRPGLQLMESYTVADRIDDILNKSVPYAFSNEFGYLTSCVSNTGTGLRVSALLHLPVLSKKNFLDDFSQNIKKRGAEIKSTIPNSNKSIGSLFQLSNRVAIGFSEVDIIEMIDGYISELIEMEDYERDLSFAESKMEMEDRIWRSYGQLQYSRKITYIEALEHLSNIRLGVILAVIKNIDLSDINDMMVNIQWAHLQRRFDRIFITTAECDEYRSEFLRGVIH